MPIHPSQLPTHEIRWDIPRRNQGQAVEVAYADAHTGASEADVGSEYKRVVDQSDTNIDTRTEYFLRADLWAKAEIARLRRLPRPLGYGTERQQFEARIAARIAEIEAQS
jgi:hypothetical protein